MKRALVTGGAGFIGSHAVDALVARGIAVDVIDDFSTGRRENITKHELVHITHGKIEEMAYDVPTMPHYDYVFHFAARARIQPSIENPLGYDSANVHGTLVALEIARASKAHFIFSSSSSVYGPQVSPLRTHQTPKPLNPYAMNKLMGEMYCQLYSDLYGIKTTMLRYFNVYGERQATDGPYQLVMGIFFGQKRAGEPLTIVGDGDQRRDFTYVADVVAANMLVMEKEITGVFNVGNGQSVSVNELADAIAGEDYPRRKIERMAEVRETLADNFPLKTLGWKPTGNVLEWARKQE
jgi:UDP-glucose 4-epimerase